MRRGATPDIDFRPLSRGDLPAMASWLARPHVAQWWTPESFDELRAHYEPVIAGVGTTRAYVVLLDGEPAGFIQSYVALDSGDGWWPDESDPGVRGIDQFLARESDLGRGIGTAMVRRFCELLFADPAVTRLQVDPAPANVRAIRCYEKAGFRAAREVVTPDGPALLMRLERPARGGWRADRRER